MKKKLCLATALFALSMGYLSAQTQQDSLAIKQAALDYIESQHNVKPEQFERAAHPRMVKRTFWTDKFAKKEYLRETFTDAMVLLAATYNQNGDKFPENPKKDVVILDVFDKTASVKLIADDWIDYMHIAKLNGKWQIVNVLWQFKDSSLH
ncbi:nuclear transport factor 2 family protein [Flagellimonas algicola]|uniref:Nuclear transport factor 2 family protein n=1 Tax=Flagellimonas algicola TaxID=2583815 RepID=A0ABY2WIS8_9FLAO|nr:nuclear transport factor 2 family protein [Allomuricauda algicola]TMU54466.1 nuclear transport factor 2 family protein [Allomuricauda algicola]